MRKKRAGRLAAEVIVGSFKVSIPVLTPTPSKSRSAVAHASATSIAAATVTTATPVCSTMASQTRVEMERMIL